MSSPRKYKTGSKASSGSESDSCSYVASKVSVWRWSERDGQTWFNGWIASLISQSVVAFQDGCEREMIWIDTYSEITSKVRVLRHGERD